MTVVKKLAGSVLGLGGVAGLLLLGSVLFNGTVSAVSSTRIGAKTDPVQENANRLVTEGRQVFRFDTFGDETVWGGVLSLQKAIELVHR